MNGVLPTLCLAVTKHLQNLILILAGGYSLVWTFDNLSGISFAAASLGIVAAIYVLWRWINAQMDQQLAAASLPDQDNA